MQMQCTACASTPSMSTIIITIFMIMVITFDFVPQTWCARPVSQSNHSCFHNQLRPHAILLHSNFGLLVQNTQVYLFTQHINRFVPFVFELHHFYPEILADQHLQLTYLLSCGNYYFRFLFFPAHYYVYVQNRSSLVQFVNMKIKSILDDDSARPLDTYQTHDYLSVRFQMHTQSDANITNPYLYQINLDDHRLFPPLNISQLEHKLIDQFMNVPNTTVTDEIYLYHDKINGPVLGSAPIGSLQCVAMHPLVPDGSIQLVTYQSIGGLQVLLMRITFTEHVPYVRFEMIGQATQPMDTIDGRCYAYAILPVPFEHHYDYKSIMITETGVYYCSQCSFAYANRPQVFGQMFNDTLYQHIGPEDDWYEEQDEDDNVYESEYLKQTLPLKSQWFAELEDNIQFLQEIPNRTNAKLLCEQSKHNGSIKCPYDHLDWADFAQINYTLKPFGPVGDDLGPFCLPNCYSFRVSDWQLAPENRLKFVPMERMWICVDTTASALQPYQLYYYVPIAICTLLLLCCIVCKRMQSKHKQMDGLEQQLYQQQQFRFELQTMLKQRQLKDI